MSEAVCSRVLLASRLMYGQGYLVVIATYSFVHLMSTPNDADEVNERGCVRDGVQRRRLKFKRWYTFVFVSTEKADKDLRRSHESSHAEQRMDLQLSEVQTANTKQVTCRSSQSTHWPALVCGSYASAAQQS